MPYSVDDEPAPPRPNRKAKERLGWKPHHASWRDGFASEFAAVRS